MASETREAVAVAVAQSPARAIALKAWPFALFIAIVLVVFLMPQAAKSSAQTEPVDLSGWGMMAGLALIAFVCEFVDSSLGMGYGTLLTPVLAIFLGLPAKAVVPAVLFSELCTGLLSGFAHHKAGNVSLRPSDRPFKVAMTLVSCSIFATAAAVFIADSIPDWALKTFIAFIVLTMGIVILALQNRRFGFSWVRIGSLGFLASFNKGMSGGGYGPLVMSGQVLSGVESKSAVGITAFAEGLTCVVGLVVYSVVSDAGIPWQWAGPMAFGAVCSVPFAAWMVSRIPAKKFTLVIAIWTIVLGTVSLLKVKPALVEAVRALVAG